MILITGGTGLIGTFVAERLLAEGERVILMDLSPDLSRTERLQKQFGDKLIIRQGDVLVWNHLVQLMIEFKPKAIMHLAYILGSESNENPVLATHVNINGTLNVLEAARFFDVERVVLASSIAVFGPDSAYSPDQLPLTDSSPQLIASGLPIYGGGKVYMEKLAEHYAEKYGLDVLGLRPSIVYGLGRARGATSFMGELVTNPALGKPVRVGFGDAQVNVIYVKDVANQFITLLQLPSDRLSSQRFFNSGGDKLTVRDIAATIERLIPGCEITVTSQGEPDVAGLAASVSDAGLAEVSGYKRQYTPIEVGLEDNFKLVRELYL